MGRWEDLVALMDRLRDPGGCPWDREQTLSDLKAYLLEESYEVVDAIDGGGAAELREELGDLLFQIVFLARIAREKGWFGVDEVISGIVEKMTRRHPHVFGDSQASTSSEVLKQWEEIKKSEKSDEAASTLDGVPRSLPALLRAQRLTTKAARVGFDWKEPSDVLAKIEEELSEVRVALRSGRPEDQQSEVGDLLFAIANLARHLGFDPESALQSANAKFARRFGRVEELLREAGRSRGHASLEEMDRLWDRVKSEERDASGAGAGGDREGS
jgi:tetrapyrrole methylase family protein / MazG family protein